MKYILEVIDSDFVPRGKFLRYPVPLRNLAETSWNLVAVRDLPVVDGTVTIYTLQIDISQADADFLTKKGYALKGLA